MERSPASTAIKNPVQNPRTRGVKGEPVLGALLLLFGVVL
jgi:hypothetical protein